MNMLKSVLMLAVVFAFSTTYNLGDTRIKRKKNKWISVVYYELSNQQTMINQYHTIEV